MFLGLGVRDRKTLDLDRLDVRIRRIIKNSLEIIPEGITSHLGLERISSRLDESAIQEEDGDEYIDQRGSQV